MLVIIEQLCLYLISPRRKISGRYCFGVVRPSEAFPSVLLSVRPPVRPSCFSIRTDILVMDFQILLSFYRNMYLHMKTAHIRFRCTAPTGNRGMALCYFQIYIVDRSTLSLRRIVKSLASYHGPSVQAGSCLQISEESTGYGSQVDKNKQVADNRQ